MKKRAIVQGVVASSLLLALSGCDKLKSLVGIGGADGGGAAATSTLSLTGLEGELDITATQKGKGGKPDTTYNMPLKVKGNKFRADMPANVSPDAAKLGNIYGIVDNDAKKAYIVLDQQKETIEIDLNTVGQQMKDFKPPTEPKSTGSKAAEPPKYPPKITKTGKTDTVAGFSCEIWDIQSTDPSDASKVDVCVAQQGVSWFHFPMTGAPAEYAALGELVDGSHFPLRAVGFDKDGKTEVGEVAVAKVDKHTLDPNLFVPPASYKVVDLATAIGGFMGGGMGQMGGPGGVGTGPGERG
ncbi:MAG: DUF4412 domain-containing protein, partial [Polyangiaceae bacterium]